MNNSNPIYTRSLPIFGQAGVDKLNNSTVMILGLGGVGGSAVDAIARAGVGRLILVDGDVFDPTNINRQAGAFISTIGKSKAEVFKARVMDINPDVVCEAHSFFYNAETEIALPLSKCDYVIDAIDDVRAKVMLAVRCSEQGKRLIACMGTGNRLDPTKLEVGDIFSTSYCPLARTMRRELRKAGVSQLDVVWSREEAIRVSGQENGFTVGSVSFVPPVAGMIMAGHVVRQLLGDTK